MRRGKRFLNNDNLLIYVGAAIFFIFVSFRNHNVYA